MATPMTLISRLYAKSNPQVYAHKKEASEKEPNTFKDELRNQFCLELKKCDLLEQINSLIELQAARKAKTNMQSNSYFSFLSKSSSLNSENNEALDNRTKIISTAYAKCISSLIDGVLISVCAMPCEKKCETLKELNRYVEELIQVDWISDQVHRVLLMQLKGLVEALEFQEKLNKELVAAKDIKSEKFLVDLGNDFVDVLKLQFYNLESMKKCDVSKAKINQLVLADKGIESHFNYAYQVFHKWNTTENAQQNKHSLQFVAALGALFSNSTLMHIAQVGSTGVDIGHAIHKLTSEKLGSITIETLMLGYLAEIGRGVISLSSHMNEVGANQDFLKVTEKLFETLKNNGKLLIEWIGKQKGNLNKINISLSLFLEAQAEGILCLDKLYSGSKRDRKSLTELTKDVFTMHAEVGSKIHAIFSLETEKAIQELEQASYESLNLTAFGEYTKLLTIGIIKEASSPLINGQFCHDYTGASINKMLKTFPIDALLGYVAGYIEKKLKVQLSKDVRPETLFYLEVRDRFTQQYRSLLEGCRSFVNDSNAMQIKDFIVSSQSVQNLFNNIKSEKHIGIQLISHYSAAINAIYNMYQEAIKFQGILAVQELIARTQTQYDLAIESWKKVASTDETYKKTYTDHLNALSDERGKIIEVLKNVRINILQNSKQFVNSVNANNIALIYLVTPDTSNQRYSYGPIPLSSSKLDLQPMAKVFFAASILSTSEISCTYVVQPKSDAKSMKEESADDGKISLSAFARATSKLQFSVKVLFKNTETDKKDSKVVDILNTNIHGTVEDQTIIQLPKNKLLTDLGTCIIANAWKNSRVQTTLQRKSSVGEAENSIPRGLLVHRKRAISMLLDSTKYKKALEELEATCNMMRVVGELAGCSDSLQAELNKSLWDGQRLTSYFRNCIQNATMETLLFPPDLEKGVKETHAIMTKISEQNLNSRYGHVLTQQICRQNVELSLLAAETLVGNRFRMQDEQSSTYARNTIVHSIPALVESVVNQMNKPSQNQLNRPSANVLAVEQRQKEADVQIRQLSAQLELMKEALLAKTEKDVKDKNVKETPTDQTKNNNQKLIEDMQEKQKEADAKIQLLSAQLERMQGGSSTKKEADDNENPVKSIKTEPVSVKSSLGQGALSLSLPSSPQGSTIPDIKPVLEVSIIPGTHEEGNKEWDNSSPTKGSFLPYNSQGAQLASKDPTSENDDWDVIDYGDPNLTPTKKESDKKEFDSKEASAAKSNVDVIVKSKEVQTSVIQNDVDTEGVVIHDTGSWNQSLQANEWFQFASSSQPPVGDAKKQTAGETVNS